MCEDRGETPRAPPVAWGWVSSASAVSSSVLLVTVSHIYSINIETRRGGHARALSVWRFNIIFARHEVRRWWTALSLDYFLLALC